MSEEPSQFGFNLYDAARLLRRDYDRRAKSLGGSRSSWQVLWHLSRNEGCHQAVLAELLDVAPISLTRQLDKLQEDGLIERRQDEDDRRRFRLYLTCKAAPQLEQMRALGAQTRAAALKGLTDEEEQQMTRLLKKVRANLCTQHNS